MRSGGAGSGDGGAGAGGMAVTGGPPQGVDPWGSRTPAKPSGARGGAGAVGSGPLPVVAAGAAVLASLALSALRLLLPDALPPAALAATIGYLLTPWAVMGALVAVQLPLLRDGDADADRNRPVAVEGRLRLLHVLAVASLVAAVPHVVVLAQLFELWWSGR